MAEKSLTSKQIKAAALCAEDNLNDDEIAAAVDVGLRTLGRWKTDPGFLDKVAEHTSRVQSAMLKLDIAKRHKRVEKLNILELKLWTVIDERAAAMEGEAPGAGTGTLVRQIKQIGSGKDSYTVEEYTVDKGLVSEIRALHEQAASELGQKVDKVAITGDVVIRRYVGVLPEDV